MLAPHPHAALEYWFFKVNAGPVALLVDWIERRRLSEHILRVNIHAPGRRGVLFEKLTSVMPRDQAWLSANRSIGRIADIAWDLSIDMRGNWIAPDIFPARLLNVTDLALVSAPLCIFTGSIRVADREYTLEAAPGMLSHYWGRKLPGEWWWVSANQFDRADVAVECSVFRSSLWGAPISASLAYLYLKCGHDEQLVMAPFSLASVSGSESRLEIRVARLGTEPITLRGFGRDFGDLGDGILNTLVGDLEVLEGGSVIARADGSAGIERRRS